MLVLRKCTVTLRLEGTETVCHLSQTISYAGDREGDKKHFLKETCFDL